MIALKTKIRNDIYAACLDGSFEDLSLLLERIPRGASRILDEVFPETEDRESCTLVTLASKAGHLDCLVALVDRGASVNRPNFVGDTPLHFAVKNDHRDCIDFLLSRGADIHFVNREGLSALEVTDSDEISGFFLSKIRSQMTRENSVIDDELTDQQHQEYRTRHYSTILKPLVRRQDDGMSLLYRPPRDNSYVLK
jgi:hypothetical protein